MYVEKTLKVAVTGHLGGRFSSKMSKMVKRKRTCLWPSPVLDSRKLYFGTPIRTGLTGRRGFVKGVKKYPKSCVFDIPRCRSVISSKKVGF